jgi:hypothetical protein
MSAETTADIQTGSTTPSGIYLSIEKLTAELSQTANANLLSGRMLYRHFCGQTSKLNSSGLQCTYVSCNDHEYFLRFQVFTAVTMKNAVFWDVTEWDVTERGSCRKRRIRGM